MVILDEGNIPHPRCPLCNILVPWRSLNGMHWHTAQCNKGAERKRQRLAAQEERAVTSMDFSAFGLQLEMVSSLKYLGRVISEGDDN